MLKKSVLVLQESIRDVANLSSAIENTLVITMSFVRLDDMELKLEVLSTLCNLLLGGFMGEKANTLLNKPSLTSFLCNSDST